MKHTIDTAHVIFGPTETCGRLGINVNHLTDGSALHHPGRPLATALTSMGARWLRFPGGEKSDAYLWAKPPFTAPSPVCCRTGGRQAGDIFRRYIADDGITYSDQTLGFDDYIALCRRIGAEPIVVVAYDSYSANVPEGGHKPTRDELIENARTWVRYANVTKKYNIRYWEVGNESYLNSYNGAVTAETYARDMVDFSVAMKGEDASIRVGANGPNGHDAVGALDADTGIPWWRTIFSRASGAFDFLSIHDYPCMQWMSYHGFLSKPVNFTAAIESARDTIAAYGASGDSDRIEIALTETNSADWYGHPKNSGWAHENTIGHAVVLFEMLAAHLMVPQLLCSLVWNTRWIRNDEPGTPQLWDALKPDNTPNPTGMILEILRKTLGLRFGRIATQHPVGCYVSETRDHRVIFLVNRDVVAHTASIDNIGDAGHPLVIGRLVGDGPDDSCPAYTEATVPRSRLAAIELPPVSITTVTIR